MYARNGSVIVHMRKDEFDGFTIEELITSFRIHHTTYVEAKVNEVDPQTRLINRRPTSGQQHWWSAKTRSEWKKSDNDS